MATRPTKHAQQAPVDTAKTAAAKMTAETAAEDGETPQTLKRRRGPRAGTESARRGGMAVREKYGPEFFAQIGSKGGKSVSAQHGPDFYADIGHRGGSSTRDKLGPEHYERIGRMGGLRLRQRERRAAQEQSAEQG
jgi:uncharacterized protein